MVDLITEEPH